MFQLDGFINWFYAGICRSLDFFTSFVHEFLDNVSFHNRFFNLAINVGNRLSPFDNLSRIHLVLFYKSIIIVFEVNSGWVFQFDSFINWFYACISRGLDFFTIFVHEFLDNVSFHNRFFNLTIDVGNRLSPFDNLSWVNLVLSHEGIIVILKVNGSWVFQFDSFINRLHSGISRGFDFFARLIDKFLYDVSFHHWFFNLLINVGDSLRSFDNLRRIHLVLFHEGVIVILKVDSSWVFQLDSFINWFHTCIRRSLDFFACFVDEFLYDVTFWLYFFIEVGDGFTEGIWNFRRIHLVLTGKLISFSFELNGFRMCQAERFANRLHTRIRLWSQLLVGSFFLKQLANRTFRIGQDLIVVDKVWTSKGNEVRVIRVFRINQ